MKYPLKNKQKKNIQFTFSSLFMFLKVSQSGVECVQTGNKLHSLCYFIESVDSCDVLSVINWQMNFDPKTITKN